MGAGSEQTAQSRADKVNHITIKLLTIAGIFIAIMSVCLLPGIYPAFAADVREQNQLMGAGTSVILAANRKAATESDAQTQVEGRDGGTASESDTKTPGGEQSGKQTSATETKPLKPFHPSEEIAADQAVDFPADI